MRLITLKKYRDVSAIMTLSLESASYHSHKYSGKIGQKINTNNMQQSSGMRAMELTDVSAINADMWERHMNTKTVFE